MILRLGRLCMIALLSTLVSSPQPRESKPNLNDRFPIKSGNELSAPIVWPVGECATAVHVSGFIAHSIVRVFLGGTMQIGIANPYFSEADITLTQALKLGDSVTATQEVSGLKSSQSAPPMIVGPYPTNLNKPVVLQPLYACGRVVPVNNLNPGTVVAVNRNGNPTPIGTANVTTAWTAVSTASLNQPDQVTATQTACPAGPGPKKVSAPSDAKGVSVDPSPMVPPTVSPYPVGADTIVLNGLYIGSLDKVLDNGTQVGIGLSNSGANKFGIQPSVSSGSHIRGSQDLCTSSGNGPIVPPSTTLNAPTILTPVCENQPFVTVQNSYPNSILVLYRNGAIAGMAGGDLGDVKMSLGGGANFALGDEVQVLQYVGSVISPRSSPVFVDCAPQDVITQHNNNSRTGAYIVETTLTPANVNTSSFGRLYSRTVNGDVLAQPLYERAVKTSQGLKNLFFIATSTNDVYAFDTDNLGPNPTDGLVWHQNLCSSVPSGVCGETASHLVGITSTPVIDASTHTMYVVTRCSNGTGGTTDGAVYIHALNVADGTDRVPPVLVQATDPDNSSVVFDFHCQRNRPGLLLSQGVVYVAFATFSCDAGCATSPYHGWVIGYRESDLTRVAVFCTSPGAGEVGIWQTGKGLVGDANGSIYFQTGNGPASEPLQDSVVKLKVISGAPGLALDGHFQPNNASSAVASGERPLGVGDTDLGSGGPMLLPGGRLIGGGKQGRYYVLDNSSMNLAQDSTPDALGFNGFQAFTNTYHNNNAIMACPAAGGAQGCDTSGAGGMCYVDPKHYGDGELCGPNIHGGPIFWEHNSTTGFIYEMPEKDYLKAFKYDLSTHKVTEAAVQTATGAFARPPTDGMPGGFSSLSADGKTNGIVWTNLPVGDGQWNLVPGRLAAFDALSLKELWNDSDNVIFAKSVPPTIADGKVIRATLINTANASDPTSFQSIILVYGLLKPAGGAGNPRGPGGAGRAPVPPRSRPFTGLCYSIDQKYANFGGSSGILGLPAGPELEVGDSRGGRYRNYRGTLRGMVNTMASAEMPAGPMPTCSVPPKNGTVVDSAIYWTATTCATVVQGDILKLWLQLGGPNSKLGYPIDDETYTSDHYGRISHFEHGDIVWYVDKGAQVQYPGFVDRLLGYPWLVPLIALILVLVLAIIVLRRWPRGPEAA